MQKGFISSSELENSILVHLKDLNNIYKLTKEKSDSVLAGGDTAETILWRDFIYARLEGLGTATG